MSLILSRRDLDFILFEWLGVEKMLEREHFAHLDRSVIDGVMDTCETLATKYFASCYQKGDREEPFFDGEAVRCLPEAGVALKAFADAGLLSSGQPLSEGGMQLPVTVERAAFAWFTAANAPAAGYAFLSMAAANLLLKHGSSEQIETYARPMLTGRFFGTMALSEPQAGSSLSDITTIAKPQEDGSFRLFGRKMWTSGGDQNFSENIVHLVLARVEGAPSGAKGISLFIVPKFLTDDEGRLGERNDVVLAGLNHKMGYRATTNTLLNFGEGKHTPEGKAGAKAFMVGRLNEGLQCMFFMMNEARIAVGTGSSSIGYTGYLHALNYARDRTQGRPPGAKDPTTPQIPLVAHVDVRRMLLAQKAFVEGALAFTLWCATLVDDAASCEDEREDAELLLDLLTPVAKSWPSQFCLAANDLAIQVHGGYGYTRDFKVEQFYRDQRLNMIHEGTHGIQAIDLLGRKVVMRGGRALDLFTKRVRATIADAVETSGELGGYARVLQRLLDRILAVTASLHKRQGTADMLANASLYLEVFGHLAIGWIWLQQAALAQGHEDDFYRGKRHAAHYFFTFELPRTDPLLDILDANEDAALRMEDHWF